MPLILLQLCSVCRVPEVPGEIRVPEKPVSSAQRESSLISGPIMLRAARPQLCPCSLLMTSICVWDTESPLQSCTFLFPSLSKSRSPSIIRAEPGMKSALLSELFVRKMFELLVLTGVHKSKTLKFHYCKVVLMRDVVQISLQHKGSSYRQQQGCP